MKRLFGFALTTAACLAQLPESIVTDGIPPTPPALRADVSRYLEFRTALFQDWHPTRRELLLTTRFADAAQLHWVQRPGGARRQITFLPEPVAGGSFRPRSGDTLVFSQDTGGGEFYQLYRFDLNTGKATLLTDGKSRNAGPRWSRSGRWLAYTSTRRNGRDTDIYAIDPADPRTDHCVAEVQGGGFHVADWSPDDRHVYLINAVSINESRLYRLDVATGKLDDLTPRAAEKVAYRQAQATPDGRALILTTDKDAEFLRLARLDLQTRALQTLAATIPWDVEEFDLSPDGRTIACAANEDGLSVLRLLDARTGRERLRPKLPAGVVSNLKWHPGGRELAFNLASAQSPTDIFSLDPRTGRTERWTESETGGLDARRFVEPELVRLRSFDGVPVSAWVYRPDAQRFPGRRPVLICIHGGPESQSRPGFLARNNYLIDELGVALVYPNVRGSAGYGKAYLTLDNGFKREDSVKDIGAVIDWAQADPRCDAQRVAVYGGSYGGYMVLASLVHFSDRLRAGIDVVGISSFLTFLQNTQDYRRDLRRVEYGDERDPAMREFLERIAPVRHVDQIRRPLLIAQGKNDPRVPASESEQMVRALRQQGGPVWYFLATDEGHGFAKKRNADAFFVSMIQFVRNHLLD